MGGESSVSTPDQTMPTADTLFLALTFTSIEYKPGPEARGNEIYCSLYVAGTCGLFEMKVGHQLPQHRIDFTYHPCSQGTTKSDR